ncbi:MAG: GTP cyclohydrolase I [Microbacteriaceae bacterium]|nr:GTP cyclohydrolase I [Microbacteriaceae bacterium]
MFVAGEDHGRGILIDTTKLATPRVDTDRIRVAVGELLAAIGEDPLREGLRETPNRVAQSYSEFFAGLGVDPLEHLQDVVAIGSASGTAMAVPFTGLGDLVLLREIEFRSMCEHHLLPFVGVAHLAYRPKDRLVGLGRLARVVDTLAARPQLQERLTEQIADALETGLAPSGVFVMLEATHLCLAARGTRQARSTTVTTAARGSLREASARTEIIAMIGLPRG